jgi:hypothetical protein
MAQVVECLPSKGKALNSNPGTAKKKEQIGNNGFNLQDKRAETAHLTSKLLEKNWNYKK